eukprot:CAMPEP_0178450650 /NCGR_PEP_ID=MMETSP0689_2-20121128/43241_1 /TAXON_ID=160604 /ORGANISM="Amphidinium massartii, Strain CS-259" /LENGTH=515 /DNA_ID=CAMNT_0020076137 /DNA_START=52 /DNA_END=1599 /DNA_ORIENTATION=-
MDALSLQALGLPLNDGAATLHRLTLTPAPAARGQAGRAGVVSRSAPAAKASAQRPSAAAVAATSKAGALTLPAGVPLAQPSPQSFSVLSYNVLLPNSNDGWWIYKYYRDLNREIAMWQQRQSLLKKQLLASLADIICLQEVSDKSFQEDFAFMQESGYTACMHEKTGRMRPATFFKEEAWEQVSASHKDRTLVMALRARSEAVKGKVIFVVNGHLAAGPNADRRLRQVQEALETVSKECKKLAVNVSDVPVIVCGDFNSQGMSGVRELLVAGTVGPDFRESGDPTEKGQDDKQLTSKVRTQQLGTFRDAMEEVYEDKAPATILAANIDSKMQFDSGELKPELLKALETAFAKAATTSTAGGEPAMSKEDTHRWLELINGQVGRGSEYRSAIAAFERRGEELLTKDDFIEVYRSELGEGKFWGVEHDLRLMNGAGMAIFEEGPVQLRFDYMYYTPDRARLLAVQEPLSEEHKQQIFGPPWEVLPNSWHPSDHLPVAERSGIAPAGPVVPQMLSTSS